MIRLLATYLFLLISSAALAQPVCKPDRTSFNMGDVMYQEPRTVTFGITNAGNKPLTITAVHPSCGCTAVEYTTTSIAPGKTGEVRATFDAAMMGTFSKDMEVWTNATDEPLYLHFYGRVTDNPSNNIMEFPIDLDNVRISANTIDFDNVNKGDMPVAELMVLNTTRMAYQPQLMHLPPYLTATYEPAIVQGGRVGRIRLTLDSKQLPDMGLTQRSVYLARYPGDRVAEDNEITVSTVLLPDFTGVGGVAPGSAPQFAINAEEIDMGPLGNKKKLTGTFTITNNGSKPLEVSRLQPFSRALGVSLPTSRIMPGKQARLKVTVTREMLQRDKNQLRILVITNDPQHPKAILTVKVHP